MDSSMRKQQKLNREKQCNQCDLLSDTLPTPQKLGIKQVTIK